MSDGEEAARLLRGGEAAALLGGGGVLEPKAVHKAIEESFLATGMPRQLTHYHSAGIGTCDDEGLNRFANEDLTKRVGGGHWGRTPRRQQRANSGQPKR